MTKGRGKISRTSWIIYVRRRSTNRRRKKPKAVPKAAPRAITPRERRELTKKSMAEKKNVQCPGTGKQQTPAEAPETTAFVNRETSNKEIARTNKMLAKKSSNRQCFRSTLRIFCSFHSIYIHIYHINSFWLFVQYTMCERIPHLNVMYFGRANKPRTILLNIVVFR